MQFTINLDLDSLVNEEYETTLREALQDCIKEELRSAVSREMRKQHEKLVAKFVEAGLDQTRIVDGEVILPTVVWRDDAH